MSVYNVGVIRIGYGYNTIQVEAKNSNDAEHNALEKAAGEYTFSDHSSEYEIDTIVELSDDGNTIISSAASCVSASIDGHRHDVSNDASIDITLKDPIESIHRIHITISYEGIGYDYMNEDHVILRSHWSHIYDMCSN